MKHPKMYQYFSLALLLALYLAQANGVASTTDGDFSAGGQWGINQAQTFDFVVVGAGASGSVVAAKLSAEKNWTVLLLEAGGASHRDLGGDDYVATTFVPNPAGGYRRGVPFTRVDVPSYYTSITDPVLYSEYQWTIANAGVGKTLGGSMAHNGMVWQHPTKQDIQNWNITGWSYNQFMPYIRACENYTNSGFAIDAATMGTNGPIQIRSAAVVLSSDYVFYNACIAAGSPVQTNFQNSGSITGVGFLSWNIGHNGTSIRQSSALKYLGPNQGRSQLTISTYSKAARLVYASTSAGSRVPPKVIGIQFIKTINGVATKQTALVRKEVILSGGAVNTPQIMFLSGIGPHDELAAQGITPVLINENVGRNIRNHLYYLMAYTGVNYPYPNFFDDAEEEISFALNGTGVYATAAGYGAVAVEIKTQANLVDPDIWVLQSANTANSTTKGFSALVIAAENEYDLGTVHLASNNPADNVLYNPNIANISNNDVQTLVRGIQAMRNIMNQPAAAAVFGAEVLPGANIKTNAALAANVRQNVALVYHYMGSCKMGNPGDPLRVVDSALRVVGISNLRVIDSSIVPGIVNALVQATMVGIGEYGSAQVISAWS